MASNEWRNLELLVQKIESVLLPEGAIIKSPDHIFDKVGKETREVDVSIRMKIGSADILILIECRNRNKAQDVRWIEEIYSKHKDLGGSRSIAVSLNSFSEQAIRKANVYNIELRTFDEITEEVIFNWNKTLKIKISSIKYQLLGVTHRYKGHYSDITTNIDRVKWNEDPFVTTLFYIQERPYTAEGIIDSTMVGQWIKDNPGQQNLRYDIAFKERAWMNTNIGPVELESISVIFKVGEEVEMLTTDNIIKYRDVISKGSYNLAEYDIKKYNNNKLEMFIISKDENITNVIENVQQGIPADA